MLTQPQVQRYSAQSGLRDIMIAEKEILLTYVLQLFSEKGILDALAFKGGTCLRKMHLGSQGRFSTDLDFTVTGQSRPFFPDRDFHRKFPRIQHYRGDQHVIEPTSPA